MPFLKLTKIWISAALLCASSTAWSNAAVNSSTSLMQRPKNDTRIWSGFLNVNRSTNLYDFQDGSRQDGMDYLTRVNLHFSKNYHLRVQGGYSQNMKDAELSDFADISATVRRNPFNIGKTWILSYFAGSSLPTSKQSRDKENLKASLRTGVIMAVNSDRLMKGLAVSGSVSVARNLHEYETDVTGAVVLNQYSSTQSLSVSYDFSKGFSLSGEFAHINALTYQGTLKESYQFSQELSYQINTSYAVAIGHTNSGEALRPNGRDYGYDIYDQDSSTIYGSLTYIF